MLGGFAATDPHLAAMERLARDMASLSAENQIDLHFALAKAYGDIGDHARSFRNLLQGNALKRQLINYNEADTRDLFRRIQDVFTPARMRGKRGLAIPRPSRCSSSACRARAPRSSSRSWRAIPRLWRR